MAADKEIIKGSTSVSVGAHAFLTSLVFNEKEPNNDAPFTSIVEAFRFAFALGYSIDKKKKSLGTTMGVAPRQFIVEKYTDLLIDNLDAEYKSLGALASGYAEAGTELMMGNKNDGNNILDLLID